MAKDLLSGWNYFPTRKKVRKQGRAAPLCLFWAIWKDRNQVVIKDMLFSSTRLKISFISTLVSWAGTTELRGLLPWVVRIDLLEAKSTFEAQYELTDKHIQTVKLRTALTLLCKMID